MSQLGQKPCWEISPVSSKSWLLPAKPWAGNRTKPFAPTTRIQRQGDGSTCLHQPPLSPPQARGESPAPAPSLSRLQPNCRSFPSGKAGGCPGCAPRAGLAGAARVPAPQARGSPCLLSSRRTGGGCITWCQPAAPARCPRRRAARLAVPLASRELPGAQGRTRGSEQARARGRLRPDV